MAHYPVDLKSFALKKETTRGTAETAPDKHIKASRDSSFDYSLELVENDRIQGVVAGEFQPEAGRKIGVGKLTIDLEAATIGEFMYSLLGTVASAQNGTTTAYTHTFSKTTSTQHQAYTLFVNRGVDYFKYNLGVVKRIEFAGDTQGKNTAAIDLLFKAEATAASFSPTIAAPDPLMFHETSFEIDDVANTNIGKWNFAIDNQSEGLWLLNSSQNLLEIPTAKKLLVEGGFDIYFTNTAQRDDFLANTPRKLECVMTGGSITTGQSYALTLAAYGARYTAVSFDTELDGGLLGASVAFKGFYSVSSAKALDATLVNTSTTY